MENGKLKMENGKWKMSERRENNGKWIVDGFFRGLSTAIKRRRCKRSTLLILNSSQIVSFAISSINYKKSRN